MYYLRIVFGIITIVIVLGSLGNIIRLAIRLFKGASDKKNVIKGTFTTALTAWMFIFFSLLFWQENEFFEPRSALIFFPAIVIISLILAFVSILPFIYWKDKSG